MDGDDVSSRGAEVGIDSAEGSARDRSRENQQGRVRIAGGGGPGMGSCMTVTGQRYLF